MIFDIVAAPPVATSKHMKVRLRHQIFGNRASHLNRPDRDVTFSLVKVK